MRFDKLSSMVCRIFFAVALVLVALALVERVLTITGYTLLRGSYTAGRMFEFAAILCIFVIALLLRQVREELKRIK